mmetsp:Transcript_43819/g.133376  ORF Transcript_43819/g.133376 Transcript_43819/m.133376 type:complete len:217 (+) Transcript_43819:1605-2255(+)
MPLSNLWANFRSCSVGTLLLNDGFTAALGSFTTGKGEVIVIEGGVLLAAADEGPFCRRLHGAPPSAVSSLTKATAASRFLSPELWPWLLSALFLARLLARRCAARNFAASTESSPHAPRVPFLALLSSASAFISCPLATNHGKLNLLGVDRFRFGYSIDDGNAEGPDSSSSALASAPHSGGVEAPPTERGLSRRGVVAAGSKTSAPTWRLSGDGVT